jgi:hypothetical protein
VLDVLAHGASPTGCLLADLSPSTIGVTLLPLRAIFRRAVSRGELAVNPCADLDLPTARGGASASPVRPRRRS